MSAAWTDAELARYHRRVAVFTQHGLDEDRAERLADQLLRRDRPEEADDRRVCFECQHFQPPRRCYAGEPAMPFVLQRCPRFNLKGMPHGKKQEAP